MLLIVIIIISSPFWRPFSRWTCVSWHQNVFILDFIGAKGDGGCCNNWSYKTRKAPVKLSLPTTTPPLPFGRICFVVLVIEKRRGEQLKRSLACRLYIGSFVFHVHNYQDQ